MPLTVTRVPQCVAKTYSDSRRKLAPLRSVATELALNLHLQLLFFRFSHLMVQQVNLLNEPSPQAFHRALWLFYQTSKVLVCSSDPLYNIYSSQTLCKLEDHWANARTEYEHLSMASLNFCSLPLGYEEAQESTFLAGEIKNKRSISGLHTQACFRDHLF